MNASKTYINKQADIIFGCSLEILQGSCLYIEVEQGQYNFYLNELCVQQIQQAKQLNFSLSIPPSLLIVIWYSICFDDNWLELKFPKFFQNIYVIFIVNFHKILINNYLACEPNLQSGITFNSYYTKEQVEASHCDESDIVLQSSISFDGDVIHKIKRNLLTDSNCLQIVSAHYWLTEQLLSSLRSKLVLLVWEISSLILACFVVKDLYRVYGFQISLFFGLIASVGFSTVRYILNKFKIYNYRKSKLFNGITWGLTCVITSIPSVVVNPINGLLTLIFSAIAPIFTSYSLSFILPLIIKLIMRRIL